MSGTTAPGEFSGDTLIVVPCYNEAARFRSDAFRDFISRTEDISFLLVNDGSTDRTAGLLDALNAELPERIAVLHLPDNVGKAEAVRRGLMLALEESKPFIGYWDADLATPLDAIPDFRDALQARPQVDILLGSRVKLLGRDIRRRAFRHYLGRVFATAASLTLRLGVYDTQCGAKLFRASDTLREILARPFDSRWIFDVELIARYLELHPWPTGPADQAPIQEHPVESWADVGGSKLRAGDWVMAALELARIGLRYRGRPPASR